jgi:hypothetical protein
VKIAIIPWAVLAILIAWICIARAETQRDYSRSWSRAPTGAESRHNALRRAYCDAEFQTALARAHFGQWTLSRGMCW